MTRKAAALMGALTADAAGLGLHWIYDTGRISQVTNGKSPAFTPINPANYEGVPAYFAHANRRDGQLSQYGETLALAMASIKAQGGFDVAAYQQAYAAHFGPGGTYIGYIDRPTKGTLNNIAAEILTPSGVDDDQHPAIATLPVIVASHGNNPATIKAAIEVTNVNEAAQHYGNLLATTLASVIEGTDLQTALATAAASEPLLQNALDTKTDPIAYGETTGRACHLHQGMPLSWCILTQTNSYKDAVELNISAGGDSAGRALIIGSLAGAAYGLDAIPTAWHSKLENAETLKATAQLP
jgi:hypothetical protein